MFQMSSGPRACVRLERLPSYGLLWKRNTFSGPAGGAKAPPLFFYPSKNMGYLMEISVELNKISSPFDEKIEEIVQDLNRKLKKSKLPSVKAKDLSWSYVWAVGFGGGGQNIDNCYVSLSGRLGRRQSLAGFFTPGQQGKPTPRHLLPPEILHAYRPRAKVDHTYKHVSVFETTGAKKTVHYATGGYTNGKDIIILNVSEGADIHDDGHAFETLLKISGKTALWSGALVRTAQNRYENTAPGDTFVYRNKKLRRLTEDEIKKATQNKSFSLSF